MKMNRREFGRQALGISGAVMFLAADAVQTASAQGKDLIRIPFGSTHAGSIRMMTDTVRRHRLDEKHGMLWEPANLQINALADVIILKSVSVGCLACPIAALARSKGHKLQMFEALTMNHSSLLVRADSPYRDIKELRGKKIAAVTRTSGTYQSFYAVARMLGVDVEKECEVVFVAPEAGRRFLQTGAVEAFNIYEPFPTNMLAAGTARELVRVRDAWKQLVGKDMLLLGVVAYEDWINANRDLAKRIALVTREAVEIIRQDPKRTIVENKETQGLDSEAAMKLAETRLIEMYTRTPLNQDLIDSAYREIQKEVEFRLLDLQPSRDLWTILPS